jgi:hypothetical protein
MLLIVVVVVLIVLLVEFVVVNKHVNKQIPSLNYHEHLTLKI